MGKILSIKENILQFIDKQRITKEEFCKKTGIASSNFRGSGMKSEIGGDKIVKILSEYTDLNPNWLLTGKGEMLKSDQDEECNTSSSISEQNEPVETSKGVPLIPMDAFAGIGDSSVFGVDLNTIEERYIVPLFDGMKVDFMISVRGVSMAPKYLPGDVVACRLIRDFHYIQSNHVYVIDTYTQGIIIKRVLKTKESITCRSDNPEYDDLTIPMTEIRSIAQVIGSIRVE